ncbi:MAG: amidohydrolase family protein [Dinghuibacter sp.]|nr:amidohydrolase family protein [Dinghuibacter sp.]
MSKFTALLLLLFTGTYARAQQTYPRNDIASPENSCYAFTQATIVKDAQTTLNNSTLVIRQGKIVSIGNAPPPPDAVVINCAGKFIYPSFIDVYSDYGMPAPPARAGGPGFNPNQPPQITTNTKGAFGWNQAIRAETDAARLFLVNDQKAREMRGNGFGTVLTHVTDGIVRGNGALVTLGTEKENLVMLSNRASAHYSLNKGSSQQEYPSSQMGSIALLRQTYYDAQWYRSKPEQEGANLSLKAFNDLQGLPQFFEAGDKWVAMRAAKIAKEFNTQYIIVGGNNEYQRIADIKALNTPFVLSLNFPQAQDVDDPNDARLVALADMQHWEMAPGNPAAFEKAGIPFALSAFGMRDATTFFTNLRKAIQYGLSENRALEALTMAPAKMLGMASAIGSLETGKIANFLVTSGPVFKERTTIWQNWVQGKPYIVKDDGVKDYRATYTLNMGAETFQMELSGDAARPTAQLMARDTIKADVKWSDRLVNISFALKRDSGKQTRLSGIGTGDSWTGNGQLPNGQWVKWSAVKAKDFVPKSDSARRGEPRRSADAMGQVSFPFNGYGYTVAPQPVNTIIKNTTVWTNEKEGKLENADVWIQNGKIAGVGKNLSAPGATVIDGTGKHVTAGIIDEHSHIAATGSINECSQSVTAEVRIGDVINPEDVNIYRQLSGGVTASHILHGSCNTIGGQTQLIKLRWGKTAEEMKFAGWDGFIKFALGENVKRTASNQNNRFPDTRMGVEQILDDAFTRARDYEKQGPGKRIDLELETLLEILNKKRFITCHSYVQSEITAMMRVADKFGFTLNTFTHILEGYKVADKMKQHGAAASTFSDWWAYKMEVVDAIPQNPWLMHKNGVLVAINSDDAEMARRLNQEAAKSVKYAGMDEQEALKMVTLNPAIMLHVGDKTGSLKTGKDADVVIWNTHPLSIYAKAEKTFVDGVLYFDRDKDAQLRAAIAKEKNRLVQKMMNAKKGGERTMPASPSFMEENYCEEDHHTGKSLAHRLEERMAETEKMNTKQITNEQ